MAKVLVLNNYCLESVWREVKRGEKPDHHLFGINYLEELGYEVNILPFRHFSLLQKVGKLLQTCPLSIPTGSLDRQFSAWLTRAKADIIYAPCGGEVNSLALLRRLGLFHIPIVVLQHHLLNRGRLAKLRDPLFNLQVCGTDAIPTLCHLVAEDVNRRRKGAEPRSRALRWGPDASFYPSPNGPGSGVVAAGRTGRDFATFGRAASRTNVTSKIFCLDHDVEPCFGKFGANVEVITPATGGVLKYSEMMDALVTARALAIPLSRASYNLSGLTSLMDALGIGKPVIMTRHPFIDLDIEKYGIGRWVESGDEEGWRQAIEWFEAHPRESLEMGKRARALVDQCGWNSRSFAKQIDEVLQLALRSHSSRN